VYLGENDVRFLSKMRFYIVNAPSRWYSRRVAPLGSPIAPMRRFSSRSEWFENEANERRYYYKLDSRGSLFLYDTKHKNMATELRDKSFLLSFFKGLRPLESPRKVHVGGFNSKDVIFKFVSLCGKEESFLEVEDDHAPFGFAELTQNGSQDVLIYAGGQAQEVFHPEKLIMGDTGRLYHPIQGHKYFRGGNHWGLLHPHLTNSLLHDSLSMDDESAPNSFKYVYKGNTFPIGKVDMDRGN